MGLVTMNVCRLSSSGSTCESTSSLPTSHRYRMVGQRPRRSFWK